MWLKQILPFWAERVFPQGKSLFRPLPITPHFFLLMSLPTTALSCVAFGDFLLESVDYFSELLIFMNCWLNSLGKIKSDSIPDGGYL